MPSQSHRDGLPSYYRMQFFRKVAAAIIRRAERSQQATPRRPGIRATAFVEKPEQTTTTDRTADSPRREPRALPASPEQHAIEAGGLPDPKWEWLRRHQGRRGQ